MLAGQFAVGIYGGYFGAGAGIVMLAVFGLMGLTNIHQMNGLKNINGICFNGIAAIAFAAMGIVNWPIALVMAIGSSIGGLRHVGTGAASAAGMGATCGDGDRHFQRRLVVSQALSSAVGTRSHLVYATTVCRRVGATKHTTCA